MIPEKLSVELREWPGVTVVRLEQGRKHRRLTLRYGEQERFLTLPTSASDYRAEANQVRDFRKVMAELGAHRNERRKPSLKRRRNKQDRDPLARVEAAPVKADPWAALRAIEVYGNPHTPPPRKGHLREALRLLAGSVQRMVARWRSHAPRTMPKPHREEQTNGCG